MSIIQEYKETTNTQLYRKLHKLNWAKQTKNCGFCSWHGGENGHKMQRSWKKFRENKYKE